MATSNCPVRAVAVIWANYWSPQNRSVNPPPLGGGVGGKPPLARRTRCSWVGASSVRCIEEPCAHWDWRAIYRVCGWSRRAQSVPGSPLYSCVASAFLFWTCREVRTSHTISTLWMSASPCDGPLVSGTLGGIEGHMDGHDRKSLPEGRQLYWEQGYSQLLIS